MNDAPNDPKPVTPVNASTGAPVLETPDDAGSQALADALRSSFAIIRVVMVALVLVFLSSGFFTVGSQEKAVILRFGKPVGEGAGSLLGPGAHWAFPYPIDEVVKMPVNQLQGITSTIGWYATTAANEAAGNEPPPGPSLNPGLDGYVVTGDENIIHVRGTLLYRISEPGLRYTFDFVATSNLVRNAFNNALLYAAAGFKVDDALRRDVAGFRDRVRARVERLITEEQLGIIVDQITLSAIPPRQLKKAFDAVNEAEVRRSTVINEARAYENQTISRARADAQGRINAGETERNVLVQSVRAEAERFKGLLAQYELNPGLFIQQRQNEVLQRVLTNAQDRIVLSHRVDGKPRELRLQINREPPVPKAVEAPAQEDHH